MTKENRLIGSFCLCMFHRIVKLYILQSLNIRKKYTGGLDLSSSIISKHHSSVKNPKDTDYL